MADKTPPQKSNAPYATRIDPTKEGLSQDQMHFIRQVELEQWKRRTSKLRTRNVVTGLAIGVLVLGICILVKRQRKTATHFTQFPRSGSWMRSTRRPSVRECRDQKPVPTEI
uniref:Cytochrome c oxidase assembly factor 3 n=1 Tax=Oreochromis aureus TaxID=47969 RepID=A0AAZ1XLK5_OREAU